MTDPSGKPKIIRDLARDARRSKAVLINIIVAMITLGLQALGYALVGDWAGALNFTLAWVMLVVNAAIAYRAGWADRAAGERTVGQWMASKLDADGIPDAPPVIGRLVIDTPERRTR